jgi:hypothetical protein
MDRQQACIEYQQKHPEAYFDHDLHIIVEDWNLGDHWIIRAIQRIAVGMIGGIDNEYERNKLYFLVDLLKLPMPEGWDEEQESVVAEWQ